MLGVATATDTNPPASPCGSCRQVLHEFGPDAFVLCANLEGEVTEDTVRGFLPAGFDPAEAPLPSGPPGAGRGS